MYSGTGANPNSISNSSRNKRHSVCYGYNYNLAAAMQAEGIILGAQFPQQYDNRFMSPRNSSPNVMKVNNRSVSPNSSSLTNLDGDTIDLQTSRKTSSKPNSPRPASDASRRLSPVSATPLQNLPSFSSLDPSSNSDPQDLFPAITSPFVSTLPPKTARAMSKYKFPSVSFSPDNLQQSPRQMQQQQSQQNIQVQQPQQKLSPRQLQQAHVSPRQHLTQSLSPNGVINNGSSTNNIQNVRVNPKQLTKTQSFDSISGGSSSRSSSPTLHVKGTLSSSMALSSSSLSDPASPSQPTPVSSVTAASSLMLSSSKSFNVNYPSAAGSSSAAAIAAATQSITFASTSSSYHRLPGIGNAQQQQQQQQRQHQYQQQQKKESMTSPYSTDIQSLYNILNKPELSGALMMKEFLLSENLYSGRVLDSWCPFRFISRDPDDIYPPTDSQSAVKKRKKKAKTHPFINPPKLYKLKVDGFKTWEKGMEKQLSSLLEQQQLQQQQLQRQQQDPGLLGPSPMHPPPIITGRNSSSDFLTPHLTPRMMSVGPVQGPPGMMRSPHHMSRSVNYAQQPEYDRWAAFALQQRQQQEFQFQQQQQQQFQMQMQAQAVEHSGRLSSSGRRKSLKMPAPQMHQYSINPIVSSSPYYYPTFCYNPMTY